MRIVFITFEYVSEPGYRSINGHGGIAASIYRATKSLRSYGHDPIVIVRSSSNETIEHDGIPVYRVDVQSKLIKFLDRIRIIRRFIPAIKWIRQSRLYNKKVQEIHKIKPVDIVEHTSFAATGICRPKNIPSIVRISSLQSLLEEGASNSKMALLEKLENKSCEKSDKIIGPSIVAAEILSEKINRDVEVIPWPFPPITNPDDDELYKDILFSKKYLLFIGSIGVLKGVKTIAKILPKLLYDYKDLHFVFVGKDDFYNGKPMMNHVWYSAGKHRGRVLYLGIVPHKQLFPIIRNAQAIVLPSRVDNLPNTLMEAMTLGKIVIGTRGASFDQLIEDGKNGFLCNRDDSEGLLNKIETLLHLSQEEKLILEKNAKKSSKVLSEEVIVPKLLNIYTETIRIFNDG